MVRLGWLAAAVGAVTLMGRGARSAPSAPPRDRLDELEARITRVEEQLAELLEIETRLFRLEAAARNAGAAMLTPSGVLDGSWPDP